MGRDLLIFLFWMALAVFAFLVSVNVFAAYSCKNYQRLTGKETKYVEFSACYIKTPNGWQHWDEYIARATTNQPKEQ